MVNQFGMSNGTGGGGGGGGGGGTSIVNIILIGVIPTTFTNLLFGQLDVIVKSAMSGAPDFRCSIAKATAVSPANTKNVQSYPAADGTEIVVTWPNGSFPVAQKSTVNWNGNYVAYILG
jgi:hypothetical protein